MSLEIVVAAVFLSSPAVEPSASTRFFLEAIRPSLLTVAVSAELLDPREYSFLILEDPDGDLAMLRSRSKEFANIPFLAECQYFPERKLINDLLAFNRAYRNYLIARQAIDPVHEEELRDAVCETDQCYQVWDTLRDARCDPYYVTVRRQSLGLLRELIGAEAFYSGQMPAPIPTRHISRK